MAARREVYFILEEHNHNEKTRTISAYEAFIVRQKLTPKRRLAARRSLLPLIVAAAAMLVLCWAAVYHGTTEQTVRVSVNGEAVGVVAEQAEAETMVEDVLRQYGAEFGFPVQSKDEITYETLRIRIEDRVPLTQAGLTAAITPYVDGYALAIGEQVIFKVASLEVLDEVLQAYTDHYTQAGDSKTVESAEIQDSYAKLAMELPPQEVVSKEDALNRLLQGGGEVVNHTVTAGESLWIIARKNNTTVEEILQANEGLTEDSMIHPGQTLNLNEERPFLTVVAKGVSVQEEVIPYTVVTREDNGVTPGGSVIRQAGVTGVKNVTYAFVEKNGRTIEKEVIEEKVVSEPVDQIVARGPAVIAVSVVASRGSGNVSGIGWPLSGNITSYFGGGRRHTGIDIDGYTGQPFYAAGAGTVSAAGWMGSYGYCILVDHGDGVSTRYAHASQLLVRAGDKVTKGQNIGLVGSTGRSTGSHLHFEIIINGGAVNPLNYL
ncbi:MAG: peptidoglycan DD-metalloendopeptidase family protein [Gracilibacteraceae bacterium]|jgi:murein DD-endopeptidase MepM/ murein hydrolase activator NlpD|nr:peptidoglycan DD-metalloendopeptidase family protein [Gracilibacteraceae bacterium]